MQIAWMVFRQTIVRIGNAPLRIPRISTRQLMILVVIAALPFGFMKARKLREILRSRAEAHALRAETWRSIARSGLKIAEQAEKDAARDRDAKQRDSPGMSRATYVFNQDGRQMMIRLHDPEDPPEKFSKAAAEFAAAMRADSERFRRYAAEHDDRCLWYRSSWGPWLPVWARSAGHRPLPDPFIRGGSGYRVEESGTTTLRFSGRQPEW